MTNATHDTPNTNTFTIERTLDLAADPRRVWEALTDKAQLSAWFGTETDLAPGPGASGWVTFGEEGRFALRIEGFEIDSYLAWRWAEAPDTEVDAGPGTLVEWRLTPGARGGTRLRLRESGLRTERRFEENTTGWFVELLELRNYLAVESWQHPIHRRLELKADRPRVWRAMTDDSELRAWWGSRMPVIVEPGWEGWFDFPEHGRHAVRIEVVEPERYLAWRWSPDEADVPLAEASQPLLVEWLLEDRPGGGTTLQLVESGFTGPAAHGDNTGGWDGEVLPNLVRLVGGEATVAPSA
jgi:uncharacterized protein YndB with AHSA1/START domain